jgi:hypothetical protein
MMPLSVGVEYLAPMPGFILMRITRNAKYW